MLLASVMLGIRYAIEPMKAAGGGSIINNSSIAGLRYRQGNILYSTLKAAVTHCTRLAGVELGPYRIRVNAISPGAIATPIFWGGSARANTLSDEDNADRMRRLQDNLAKATPVARSGVSHDIAEAALFLASDAGSYVNAHDLVVDGGRTWDVQQQSRRRRAWAGTEQAVRLDRRIRYLHLRQLVVRHDPAEAAAHHFGADETQYFVRVVHAQRPRQDTGRQSRTDTWRITHFTFGRWVAFIDSTS